MFHDFSEPQASPLAFWLVQQATYTVQPHLFKRIVAGYIVIVIRASLTALA